MNIEHLIEKKVTSNNNSINIKDTNQESKRLNGIENTSENHSFISIVSHNIKNPFATLLGFLDLLSEDYNELSDTERKFYLLETKKSANFTYKYIERFFEWIYYKTGKIKPDFCNINLYVNIKDAIKKLPQELQSKCKIDFNFDKNINIYADDESIQKAFYYIIENAIKFSERNKKIKIEAKQNQNFIDVKIIDEGTGISETDINKLFDYCQDASIIAAKNEKGTGLGLILAKLLVEINGGSISVQSKMGTGSTFSIKLPFV